ncbi:MAG TPA: GntR family transcriptional regulator [Afipia sp.]
MRIFNFGLADRRMRKDQALKPVERNSLWDQAYAELRQALLAGRFAPGDRIVLRDIATELEISLTPVRDAVNRLIAERILERGSSGQGGGAMVPALTKIQFDELVIIRCDLEGRAASRAAALASKESVATLQSLLKRMKALIREKRPQDYLDLHRQFHFAIYAEARMPLLLEMIENVWLRCGPGLNYFVSRHTLGSKLASNTTGRSMASSISAKAVDHHALAVDAIARRDCEGAASAIMENISEAGRYIADLADEKGIIRPPPGSNSLQSTETARVPTA